MGEKQTSTEATTKLKVNMAHFDHAPVTIDSGRKTTERRKRLMLSMSVSVSIWRGAIQGEREREREACKVRIETRKLAVDWMVCLQTN